MNIKLHTIKQLFIIILFMFSMIMVSCSPESVEIEMPQTNSAPVVITQQVSQNEVLIFLTRTHAANSAVKPIWVDSNNIRIPEELLITDAEIYIQHQSSRIQLNQLENGIYMLQDFTLIPGETYTLQISIKGDENQYTAAYTQLDKPTINHAEILSVDGADKNKLKFSFDAKSDYYLVQYYTRLSNESIPTNIKDISSFTKKMLEQNLNFDLYSSGEAINGEIQVTKQFNKSLGDSVLISLTRIQYDYYLYLKQLKQSRSVLNQMKGEIVHLQGNISNGYGYFALGVPDFKLVIGQ